MSNRLAENLKSGLQWGLYFAVVFSLIATVTVLTRGVDLRAEYHVSYLELIATYIGGGLLGGGIVGLMLPLTRWTLGAMFVGFVAVLPFGFVVSYQITPVSQWPTKIPLLPILGSALLGPLGALVIKIGLERGRK